jgi:hypothetical protein
MLKPAAHDLRCREGRKITDARYSAPCEAVFPAAELTSGTPEDSWWCAGRVVNSANHHGWSDSPPVASVVVDDRSWDLRPVVMFEGYGQGKRGIHGMGLRGAGCDA